MRRGCGQWLSMALAVMGVGLVAEGGAQPPQPTGLFSNLKYVEEGGDLVGMEVYLVQGATNLVAVVQCAGGAPTDPAVVRVDASGGRIRFTLPQPRGDCGTEFEGVVTDKGLRGGFAGEVTQRWLPRKKGYWQ